MKKVSSKVIKSAPFVDRRLRDDSSKNKYRRTDDIPPQNISFDPVRHEFRRESGDIAPNRRTGVPNRRTQDRTKSHAINSATYKVTSGKLKTSNRNCPRRRLLDFYA
jgi:hypothetical protein